MSPPAEDRSSESKRHRSPISRDPSPKRYRTDDDPEPDIPPGFSEMDKVRSDPVVEHQDKSPLAPKHENCGVGPYRRCFARKTDSVCGWGSNPKEHLKHTSKSPLRVQNIPAYDLQKTVKATTAGHLPVEVRKFRRGAICSWRRKDLPSLWGLELCPGYDSKNRPIKKEGDTSEDDTSGDDTSGDDASGDDASGDDASDVSDGDGDRNRKLMEELVMNSIVGKNRR